MPRPPRRAAALAGLLASSVAVQPPARAASDPWFGKDKALHFSASAGLAAAGYATAARYSDDTSTRLLTGGTLALAVGVGKELYDLTGAGDPSWRDLTWDVVGTATGLALTWALDRLWHRLFDLDARTASD